MKRLDERVHQAVREGRLTPAAGELWFSTKEEAMGDYELKAVLGDEVRVEEVFGDDRNMPERIVPLMVGEGATPAQVTDADAALAAIPLILNRAVDDEVWAKGRITLTNLKTGVVVREMEAK